MQGFTNSFKQIKPLNDFINLAAPIKVVGRNYLRVFHSLSPQSQHYVFIDIVSRLRNVRIEYTLICFVLVQLINMRSLLAHSKVMQMFWVIL